MRKKKNNFLLVIPARYKSKRFPGKPLAKIKGVAMLKRTYIQCKKAINKKNIIIATDDLRIQKYCLKNDMPVFMTSKKCLTGTDRVVEVAKKKIFDFYVNVQGDEPIFNPLDIKNLIKSMYKNKNSVLTGFCPINEKEIIANEDFSKIEKHILFYDNINFKTESSDLSNGEKSKLDKLIEDLKNNPKWTVNSIGHTDNTGSMKYNQILSVLRSESVKTYIINGGISFKRIETIGMGEIHPLAENVAANGSKCFKN